MTGCRNRGKHWINKRKKNWRKQTQDARTRLSGPKKMHGRLTHGRGRGEILERAAQRQDGHGRRMPKTKLRTQHSTTSAACSHPTRSRTGRAGPLRLSHTRAPSSSSQGSATIFFTPQRVGTVLGDLCSLWIFFVALCLFFLNLLEIYVLLESIFFSDGRASEVSGDNNRPR